jgi:hypothetical protein
MNTLDSGLCLFPSGVQLHQDMQIKQVMAAIAVSKVGATINYARRSQFVGQAVGSSDFS